MNERYHPRGPDDSNNPYNRKPPRFQGLEVRQAAFEQYLSDEDFRAQVNRKRGFAVGLGAVLALAAGLVGVASNNPDLLKPNKPRPKVDAPENPDPNKDDDRVHPRVNDKNQGQRGL